MRFGSSLFALILLAVTAYGGPGPALDPRFLGGPVQAVPESGTTALLLVLGVLPVLALARVLSRRGNGAAKIRV